jgi:hypothetical protein
VWGSRRETFSKHLFAVLSGKAPAFSGLLEAIDFGVKSDLATRPQLPTQDPDFAGVYGKNFLQSPGVQIPTHSGQVFRIDAGRDSDLKPATIPN